jgi:hypothetical protein
MLSGDFFENYGKYDDFFKTLENPQTFKRYKKYVIDRPAFQTQCNTKWEEAFGGLTEQGAVVET